MEMSERKPLLSHRVLYLPTDALHPNPHQPRREFAPGPLAELAESIRRHGIIQPLTVRHSADGWELIAGERRLRAAKLAGLKVRGDAGRAVLFCLTLMLPTVVFNGAYWGQCDVIYTSLCLLALYHALQKRSAWSMTLFGVALSFKLQTVFFLPTLLPLWLRKDIKLRHLVLIPAAYMAMMIPAFWGGKSLHHVLTVYLAQAGGYNGISINGPSLYNLLPSTMDNGMLYDLFGSMAMALGLAMMVVVCLMLCLNRTHITREGTLLACLLVLGGVPFFLPKMHERYTFGADVLALVIAAYRPKRMALPLLFGLASYICYTGGLPGDAIFDLKWATLFQGAAVALTAAALYKSLHEEKTEAVLTEVKA